MNSSVGQQVRWEREASFSSLWASPWLTNLVPKSSRAKALGIWPQPWCWMKGWSSEVWMGRLSTASQGRTPGLRAAFSFQRVAFRWWLLDWRFSWSLVPSAAPLATLALPLVSELVLLLLFSCSVVSDSFLTPWTVTLQASSVHGISQARILEWAAVFFSRGSSRPRDWTLVSCSAGGFFTTEPLGNVS